MDKVEGKYFKLVPPDVIQKLWPTMSYYIEQALPPLSKGNEFWKGNMLKALVTGKMGCWVGYKDGSIRLFVTAAICTDPILGHKSLFIYSYSALGEMTPQEIQWGFGKLKEFAKKYGCLKIVAFTDLDSMKKMFERLGGTSSYSLEMEV